MPRIFSQLNQPYYIYSPHFHQTSGGARALHYLCHALNLIGEEAYALDPRVNPELRTPVLTQDIIRAHQNSGRSPIAIYPEVVSNNPFNAKNVVRYLLAEPGRYTNQAIDLQPNDLIYTFGPSIVPPGWDADLLRVPLVDTRIFNSDGCDNNARKGSAVFIHRHLNNGGTLHPITENSIEISYRVLERSADDLAKIFRKVECLYVYEHSTICFEALLCGCPVIYILNETSLPNSYPWLMKGNGISWSLDAAEIALAKHTIHKVAQTYQEEEENFWMDLRSFVEKTQKHAVDLNGSSSYRDTTTALYKPPVSIDAPVAIVRKKRLLVYSIESTWSPCPQIRLIRPFAHLGDEWELEWGIKNGQLDTNAAQNADLILMHRFTPGLLPISALDIIFSLGKPVIYESDDLLNEIPADHPEAAAGASWKDGIEYTVKRAKAVVVSTPFLAEKYRALNPAVHILPNYIDFDIFYSPVPVRQDQCITIGLLGSSIQPSNFALVDEPLRALCEKYQGRLKIYFVGWACPAGWENHPQAEFTSFIHEYVNYAEQLKEMHWDIALIPLANDEYNQCKSYIKWLDYSAAGIASIFSDVSVYNSVVTHDHTGLLMPNSNQAWLDAITLLIESPEKRQQLAVTAQQEVRLDYGLREKVNLYNEVYSGLLPVTVQRESVTATVAEATQTTLNRTAAAIAKPPVSTDVAPDRSYAIDERIPAVLIFDPHGEIREVEKTIMSLSPGLHPRTKIVVVTTSSVTTNTFENRVQLVHAEFHNYATTLANVQHHSNYNWLLLTEAGHRFSPANLPGLQQVIDGKAL